jgi:hypothetical protein
MMRLPNLAALCLSTGMGAPEDSDDEFNPRPTPKNKRAQYLAAARDDSEPDESLDDRDRRPYSQSVPEPLPEYMRGYTPMARGDGGPLPQHPPPPDDPDDAAMAEANEWIKQNTAAPQLLLPAPAPEDDKAYDSDTTRLGKDDEGPSTPPPPPPPPAPPPAPAQPTPRFTLSGVVQPLQGPWLMQGFTAKMPKLYVAQTKLRNDKGKRVEEFGVFCHTRIKAGSFICAFTGTFMPKSKFNKMSNAKANRVMRRHAVELKFSAVGGVQEESQMLFAIPEALSGTNDLVSEVVSGPNFSTRHVAQCLNEPPEGTRANAKFFTHHYAHDVRKGEYYSAVLVYATEDIPARNEVYLHYGDGYAEERVRYKYVAGEAAQWPDGLQETPSMDDVVSNILANGERLDEILWKESQDDVEELVPQSGSRSRPKKQ